MFEALKYLKELAPQSYLACLYLPSKVRDDVATFYAFEAEINRIPHLVSGPMPGEIRLQWWRDLIKSGDNAGSGPLAAALMDVIGKHDLPQETFNAFLNAKIFDLYQDPMPDIATLEGYLGETHSALLQLSCLIGGAERSTELADACGHGGVALGLSHILSTQVWHRHTQRMFVPLEIVEKHGLIREAWLAQDVGEKHLDVIKDVQSLMLLHLDKSRETIAKLPKPLRSYFLPLALVASVGKVNAALFEKPANVSPLALQWRFFKASITGV